MSLELDTRRLRTAALPARWFHALRHFALVFLLFMSACALPILPALIRNYAVAGECVPISYYGGVNLYIGNNPNAKGYSAEIPDLETIAGMKSWNCFDYPQLVHHLGAHLGKDPFTFSDASHYFSARATAFWREHPRDALALTLRKALYFWGPAEISDSKAIALERAQSPLLRWLPGFPAALALGALGIALTLLRRRNAAVGLFLLFIVTYFLSVLPFFIAGRYRLPIVPVLLLFGAAGVTETLAALRSRDIRALAAGCVAVTAAILLGGVAWLPYAPNAAQWHRQRATAYSAQGHFAEAAREYDATLALDPNNAESLAGRGFCRTRLGETDAGLQDYDAALALAPNDAYTHNNLGFDLARLGRYADAEAQYRDTIRLDPKFGLARNNLGNLLVETGRMDEALALFHAILEDTPHEPHVRFNLANALWRQGNLKEAEALLRAALDDNPNSPDIPNNLGLLLAQQHRYDEAKHYYEAALRLDPTYAKAHFNLANILGEEGGLEAALRHYDAALAADPTLEQAKQNRTAVQTAQQRQKESH